MKLSSSKSETLLQKSDCHKLLLKSNVKITELKGLTTLLSDSNDKNPNSKLCPAKNPKDSHKEKQNTNSWSKDRNMSRTQQLKMTKPTNKFARIANRITNDSICTERFRKSTITNRNITFLHLTKCVSLKEQLPEQTFKAAPAAFDETIMRIIRQKLLCTNDFETEIHRDCIFRSEVLCTRTQENDETQVLVHWHPEMIFPDEWIPQSELELTKIIPLRQIPSHCIKILYPQMFPRAKEGKTPRKWKPCA